VGPDPKPDPEEEALNIDPASIPKEIRFDAPAPPDPLSHEPLWVAPARKSARPVPGPSLVPEAPPLPLL
jgi:hypothetical protein